MGNSALAAAPGIGGFVGGLAGGVLGAPAAGVGAFPGAIAGAGVGGAIGEGIREVGSGHNLDPGKIALGGGEQALWEVGGGLIGKGAHAVARPIMKGAIRASKSLQRQFPDIVETALGRGLSVTKGGAAKAARLRGASAQTTSDLLTNARAAGTKFNPHDVVARADKALMDPALPNEDATIIAKQVANFLDQYKGDIDPVLLQDIKQIYQTRSVPGYAADAAGKKAAGQSAHGQFNKALARGAREQLGTIPGVAAQDAETQSLIGVERALKDATMRHQGRLEIMKPGTYPIVGAAGSPAVTSTFARLLNSSAFKKFARQTPRGASELMKFAMYSDQPDATAAQ